MDHYLLRATNLLKLRLVFGYVIRAPVAYFDMRLLAKFHLQSVIVHLPINARNERGERKKKKQNNVPVRLQL